MRFILTAQYERLFLDPHLLDKRSALCRYHSHFIYFAIAKIIIYDCKSESTEAYYYIYIFSTYTYLYVYLYICDLILTANWDPYKRKEEPNPKEQKHSLLQPASSNHVMIFFGKSVY